jgi:squalene-hopene/tetraprenyl-beta-curcumene cyclase
MTGALDSTIATLSARLLAQRNAAGHWEGRLSTSARSTATAAIALSLAARAGIGPYAPHAGRAFEWLAANQNADGGWGDTILSRSNISTTALCWAALSLDRSRSTATARAGEWMRAAAGSLEPKALHAAILRRYGKDHTFSVPILTVLAITGKLGSLPQAWRMVPQLPFELAACPHQWFQFLRLPVVSYALPALIAIGQVRHRHAPTRNPLTRAFRSAAGRRTLDLLREIQPESGGYLEATPLTSFVVMSLIDAGLTQHPVVAAGLGFLVDSVREDGSWPIDTNLATWVTTLAVNALQPGTALAAAEGARIADWLLAQQYREEHPYTHAAPGGWAWTNLSGGVPDADDTPGALVALHHLLPSDPRAHAAAEAGIEWLLNLQNSDGGIPTFCRGWGALPFDRSAADLTAHTLQAFDAWQPVLPAPLQAKVRKSTHRAVDYLARTQHTNGSWLPLWFGHQDAPGEDNPVYGTARVLAGLATCDLPGARASHQRGVDWLSRAQNPDGGWGGAPGVASSIEETGVALRALAGVAGNEIIEPAVDWLVRATHAGEQTPPSPIGLYFARLWYFEDLYPLVFSLSGLRAVMDRRQKSGDRRPPRTPGDAA